MKKRDRETGSGNEFFNRDRMLTRRIERSDKVTVMNRRRLSRGFGLIVILFVVLLFRVAWWQIINADELKEKAIAMQQVDTEVEAVRGVIYDSNDNVLAKTITEYELYGYTQYIFKSKELTQKEKDKTISRLVKLTGDDEKTIRKRLKDDDSLAFLGSGLDQKDVDKAKEYWGDYVVVKTKSARYYPNGAFLAQVLGGVDANNRGRTGLEYQYNTELSGINGRTVKTTDTQGNTVASGKTKYYKAEDGYNLVTTVDSVIQNYVEDALEHAMKRTGAESITCIVMDPHTGEILALAATPEYDPNDSTEPSDPSEKEKFRSMSIDEQSAYLSEMWKISAISNIYEPGSTFKLICAASALETGIANDSSSYYCGGSIHVEDAELGCMGYHGTQSLKVAVGNSCNAALARVALDMGAERYYNYINLFGFNDKTGIDLPGETTSIVKDPVGLSPVDLATTGYGQGIAITPLQVLMAVSSMGNDGVLVQPRIVSKIVDNDGNVIKEFKTNKVRQVISEDTAKKMCDIMEYYTRDAMGDQAYSPGFRIGGKTGTANIATDYGYSDSQTDTSYVAMAPMDDPVVSMIVIVHKPTKTMYGNNTTGPIVKEVMEKTLTYMGIQRKYDKGERAEARKDTVSVPDVTGMNSKKAISTLKDAGLKYKIMPDDKGDESFVVVDQYPKAGDKTEKNSKVYIYSE